MTELVNIAIKDGRRFVSGRELHKALRVETRYNDWFQRMVEYGFTEGKDFYSFLSKTPEGGRPSTDHLLTIEMAKHIAMIQRTEVGRRIRDYFIECERIATEPPKPQSLTETVVAGLLAANQIIEQQKVDLAAAGKLLIEQEPLVRFAKVVGETKNNMLIGTFAKILNDNGYLERKFRNFRKNTMLFIDGLNGMVYIRVCSERNDSFHPGEFNDAEARATPEAARREASREKGTAIFDQRTGTARRSISVDRDAEYLFPLVGKRHPRRSRKDRAGTQEVKMAVLHRGKLTNGQNV